MIGPSFVEILVILVIALLVLGPQRLPGIARSIGRGLREVRKVQKEVRGVWTDVEERVTKGDSAGDPTGDPVGDPVGDRVGDPKVDERQPPPGDAQVPFEGSDEVDAAPGPATGGDPEPQAAAVGGGRKLGDS